MIAAALQEDLDRVSEQQNRSVHSFIAMNPHHSRVADAREIEGANESFYATLTPRSREIVLLLAHENDRQSILEHI